MKFQAIPFTIWKFHEISRTVHDNLHEVDHVDGGIGDEAEVFHPNILLHSRRFHYFIRAMAIIC